jgi:hypothetical protein
VLETPLLRLGKRLDAVILAPGVVVLIEYKMRAARFDAQAIVQTERYAQSLRDFHQASQTRLIIPILCAEKAPAIELTLDACDGVVRLLLTNAASLRDALHLATGKFDASAEPLDGRALDASPYRPTPTIVEAAQALYAGRKISEIGRSDAADAELQAAAQLLQEIVARAREEASHTVCFVTGAPGAGKTLLGLDLALKSRSAADPAALLSGNRPLVHVLTEALASDSASRKVMTKGRRNTKLTPPSKTSSAISSSTPTAPRRLSTLSSLMRPREPGTRKSAKN